MPTTFVTKLDTFRIGLCNIGEKLLNCWTECKGDSLLSSYKCVCSRLTDDNFCLLQVIRKDLNETDFHFLSETRMHHLQSKDYLLVTNHH